jgi:hypothetical protein
MRQFSNNMWSLPMVMVPADVDPLNKLAAVLSDVAGAYSLVSAVCIVERLDENIIGGKYHSYIYDIRYKGKVVPECSQKDGRYIKGQWMQIDAIKLQKHISHPTTVLLDAMEKDSCLK